MMTLDDGSTDGKADPHTATLSGIECFEESARSLRFETHPRILHGLAHTIIFVSFSSDHQLPRTIVDAAHRVQGVPEQVQDDLLKLDTIACDAWEVVGKLPSQNHPASLQLAQRQCNHLSCGLIQIHRFGRGVLLGKEST